MIPNRAMMRMAAFAITLAGGLATARAGAPGPEGRWKTMDDASHQPKSIVSLRILDGRLEGKVDSLFRRPGEDADPVCNRCSGELQGKRILGMTFLSGLMRDGEWWQGGTVLDPANGKTYRCKLKLSGGGDTLSVRGYLGVALLGRTQTWVRVH